MKNSCVLFVLTCLIQITLSTYWLRTDPNFVIEDNTNSQLGASPAIASNTCLNITLVVWSTGNTLYSRTSRAPYTEWTDQQTVTALEPGETFVNSTSTFTCSTSYPDSSCVRVLDMWPERERIVAAVLVETSSAVEVRTFIYSSSGWRDGQVLAAGARDLVHALTLRGDHTGSWLLAWIANTTMHYTVSSDGRVWRAVATAPAKLFQLSVVPLGRQAWALGYMSRLSQNNYVAFVLAELRVGAEDVWSGPYGAQEPELLVSYGSATHLGPFGITYSAGVYTYMTALGQTEYRTRDTPWLRSSFILFGQSSRMYSIGSFSIQSLAGTPYYARWWSGVADTWTRSHLRPATEAPGMSILGSLTIDSNGYALLTAVKESVPRTMYVAVVTDLPNLGLTCDSQNRTLLKDYCPFAQCAIEAGNTITVRANETFDVQELYVRSGGVLTLEGKLVARSLVLEANSTIQVREHALNVTGCAQLDGYVELHYDRSSHSATPITLINYGCLVGGEREEVVETAEGCISYSYSSLQLTAMQVSCDKQTVQANSYGIYIAMGSSIGAALLIVAAIMLFFRHRVFSFRKRQKAAAG